VKNENLQNKKIKYEELKEKITKKYNDEMKRMKKIIEAIEENSVINEDDPLETIIFKKYLEVENVQKVAKYINDLGYRIKTESYIGERKYIGGDITDILMSDVNVEKKLKQVVKELQEKNYSDMLKIWV
jgi:hypothetical protein